MLGLSQKTDVATLEKHVGETPLQALERFRNEAGIEKETPLAYAGRLDPMASGKLLVLIGDACKQQTRYHGLDKAYEFETLFGVHSDTGDVLGIVDGCRHAKPRPDALKEAAKRLRGTLALPYPRFSSKTVNGKPLHIWTLEGKIDEIHIPINRTTVYKLRYEDHYRLSIAELKDAVFAKIDTLPKVTEPTKALGEDFRREKVKASWEQILKNTEYSEFTVARFSCVSSSGTYMRTLAEELAKEAGGCGLAFSIHRTAIGKYIPLTRYFGFWRTRY